MDPEPVTDGLQWWSERKDLYPCLSRMALDYLSIPGTFYFFIYNSSSHIFLATSVDVERVFSTGRIILSHLRNRLSVQSIRALMCVGAWSKMGYVKTRDITDVTMLDDIEEGGVEEELKDGWDIINVV
jgi:hAT family C-terminal dimerisation region